MNNYLNVILLSLFLSSCSLIDTQRFAPNYVNAFNSIKGSIYGYNESLISPQLVEQISFGINFTVLVDGQPKEVNLKEMLEAFIKHRKDIITKRTKYDLRRAKERGHIVEGLMVAIANIDEVITIIKKSKDPKLAAEALCKKDWKAGPVEAILKKVALEPGGRTTIGAVG